MMTQDGPNCPLKVETRVQISLGLRRPEAFFVVLGSPPGDTLGDTSGQAGPRLRGALRRGAHHQSPISASRRAEVLRGLAGGP